MAIAYNSTSYVNEIAGGATSWTWAHTCNASDTKLVVIAGGRVIASGVTYNGDALTEINTETSNYQKGWFGYLDNPDVGSEYNIVVSFDSSSTYRSSNAVGISGCTAGIGNNATKAFESNTGAVTTSLTTGTNNSDVLYALGCNTYTHEISGATKIVENTTTNWAYKMAYENAVTAGSFSASADVPGTGAYNYTGHAVEIKIATASGPAKLKTYNGTAKAKLKTINGTAIAKVKSINGIV